MFLEKKKKKKKSGKYFEQQYYKPILRKGYSIEKQIINQFQIVCNNDFLTILINIWLKFTNSNGDSLTSSCSCLSILLLTACFFCRATFTL